MRIVVVVLLFATAEASCNDGILDGDEVDVDCGGENCPGCAIGKLCVLNSDCKSKKCDKGDDICTKPTLRKKKHKAVPKMTTSPTMTPTAQSTAQRTTKDGDDDDDDDDDKPKPPRKKKSLTSTASAAYQKFEAQISQPTPVPTSAPTEIAVPTFVPTPAPAPTNMPTVFKRKVSVGGKNKQCIRAIKKVCPNLYQMDCMKCVFNNMADLNTDGGCTANDQKMVLAFCHRDQNDDGAGDDEDDDSADKGPPTNQPTARPTTWLEAFSPHDVFEQFNKKASPTAFPISPTATPTATPTTSVPTVTPTKPPTNFPTWSAFSKAIKAKYAEIEKEEKMKVHYHGHQIVPPQPTVELPVAASHSLPPNANGDEFPGEAVPTTLRVPQLTTKPGEDPAFAPPNINSETRTTAAHTAHSTSNAADPCEHLYNEVQHSCTPIQYKGSWCVKMCTKKIEANPQNAGFLRQCPTEWKKKLTDDFCWSKADCVPVH
jgi:hypothetical protein